MIKFWNDYPEIYNDLEDIKKIINDNVKEKYASDPLSPMIETGGKMLRPAFLLISGRFGNYDSQRLKNLAAIIEMLHMATLIHDDVIDDSELRRGTPSVQSKYGKDYAVYMGDFLFCKCFMLLSKDYGIEDMHEISKVISKICLSEMKQNFFRRSLDISLKEYLKIVAGKTAALFSLSFYVGAKESNCDEKLSKLLGKIGYDIGMAFQIIDDILDYSGTENTTGKSIKNDLKQGYYTIPLILSLKDDNYLYNLVNNKTLNDEDIDKVYDLVKNSNGIDEARKLAKRFTNRAFKRISKLPDIQSKEILLDVMNKLLVRKY